MVFRFEEYEVDAAAFELRRAGRPVPVEPQVFDVLAYLVKNQGRVVSRDELLDNVWNDRYVSDSALSSRVMSARKAVGDTGKSQRLIKTLHGRGFKFVGSVSQVGDSVPAVEEPKAAQTRHAVGREKELQQLRYALKSATGGDRRSVFICGPPGAGKTTLLRDFLVEAAGGAIVLFGQCHASAGTGEPYRPVLKALSDLATEVTDAPVERVLLQRAPSWLLQMPSLGSAEDRASAQERAVGTTQARMLRELIDAIESLAEARPVVLAIDDLHWADTSTMEAVVALSRSLAASRVMVIGASRLDEADEASQRIADTVRDLAVRGDASLIELGDLDREAVALLLRSRLDEQTVTENLVGAVHRRTGGHPLFLTTVIDQVAIHGPDSLKELPSNITQFVEMQFRELSDADKDVVGSASCVGRDFCSMAVAAMLETDPAENEERCLALGRTGRFFVRNGSERISTGETFALFKFGHDVVFEVVHEIIPPTRRALWHKRFADWSVTAFDWELDRRASGLARHYKEGNDRAKHAEYLAFAAEVALRKASALDALRHVRDGMQAIKTLDDPDLKEKLELRLQMVHAPALVTVDGWSADVESSYDRALELVEKHGDRSDKFRLVHGLATLFELRGEYERTEAILKEMADVEAQELLACSKFHQGEFAKSIEHAEAAIRACDEPHSDLTASYGENPAISSNQWAGLSLWFLGKPQEALERTEAAVNAAEEPGHAYSLAQARGQMAFLHQVRNDPEQTRHWAEATIAVGERHGLPYRIASGTLLLGWAQVALGDAEQGVRNMEHGLEQVRKHGVLMQEPYLLGVVADGMGRAGRHEKALAYIEEALAKANEKRGFFFLAELLRIRGDLAEGKEQADWYWKAVRVAREQGASPLTIRSLASLVEIGDPKAADQLKKMLANVPPDFVCPDVDRAEDVLGGKVRK